MHTLHTSSKLNDKLKIIEESKREQDSWQLTNCTTMFKSINPNIKEFKVN